MSLPTAFLKPGEADRIAAGHPWVYSNSIQRLTHPAGDGDVVQVKDSRQRFLGIGFFNSKSKIHIRMFDTERVELDQGFFERRIRSALALRQRHMPSATSYRLVNAESDFLSGLIVDRYEDGLVLQISSLGMDQRRAAIIGALKTVCSPRFIVDRSDTASRKFEGLPESTGVLWGDDPGVMQIRLNQLAFEIDLRAGHKTGLYLDQQVNYRRVAELAQGADVLDTFSFLGGFGLHAAKAGAKSVLGIDQSEEAVKAAAHNAAANGVDGICRFEAANAFDWLKAQSAPGTPAQPRFDLIILDPPSFTRTRAAVPDALRGYKEIHLRALRLLRPGGVLATFCCSHHVDARLFEDVILSAAYDARRVLRRVAIYSQGPDHPVIPSIPETEYLKGFAYEIAR